MDSVNKTLYIPLCGKAYVSKRGLFLDDKKAEELWAAEGFSLKGKARSRWLAFYMGIRSAVFDDWTKEQLSKEKDAAVIHIGCGLDSRVLRVGTVGYKWYDVDFSEVIGERKRYYAENDSYRMLSGDVRQNGWLSDIPERESAVVVMEGVSMYLTADELRALLTELGAHFEKVALLTDCYSVLAASLSKYKNPVKEVGVTKVYGLDDPLLAEGGGIVFVKEHEMTPKRYIDELDGIEKRIFGKLYAGRMSAKLYRLFEYRKG